MKFNKKARNVVLVVLLALVMVAPSDIFFRDSYSDAQDFADSLSFANRLIGGYGDSQNYYARYLNVYGQYCDIVLSKTPVGFVRLERSAFEVQRQNIETDFGSCVFSRINVLGRTDSFFVVEIQSDRELPETILEIDGTQLFGKRVWAKDNNYYSIYLSLKAAEFSGFGVELFGGVYSAK